MTIGSSLCRFGVIKSTPPEKARSEQLLVAGMPTKSRAIFANCGYMHSLALKKN